MTSYCEKKMRLKEHFTRHLAESSTRQATDRYNELLPKIQEFGTIFNDGIGQDVLTVNEDGSISYKGAIEFRKESYVDNTGRLPFTFDYVLGPFSLSKGYTDKLSTLEGLPKETSDLNVYCSTHKPPSFFEGHFPKKLGNLDLEAVSLQNCKFGIETVTKKIELTVEDGVKNLEGLPVTIPRLTLNFPPSYVRSFKGLKNVHVLQFWYQRPNELNAHETGVMDFELGDLVEHAHSIYKIATNQSFLKAGTPMLSMFKINSLTELECNNMIVDDCKNVFKILNKYLPENDVFGAQEELIDNGFEQYARVK